MKRKEVKKIVLDVRGETNYGGMTDARWLLKLKLMLTQTSNCGLDMICLAKALRLLYLQTKTKTRGNFSFAVRSAAEKMMSISSRLLFRFQLRPLGITARTPRGLFFAHTIDASRQSFNL